MKETIIILCATDNNYAPYCGIMLSSVFENNRDSEVKAYVLIDKPMDRRNTNRFDRLAKKFGGSIVFVMVDNSFLGKFPIKGMEYWSIATYYRLYAAELLPKDVHRILYLDCDIIVQGDLRALWEIDMTDKAAAGVSDIYECSGKFQRQLHYSEGAGYFNAGVLLINLDYWREYAIGQQLLDFLANHYDLIEANDQDVLNAVLWDKKISLPLTYNYQLQFLSKYFFDLQSPEMQKQIMNTFQSPCVIHYAYSIKPWSMMYYKLPFGQEWKHYKRISQWSHTCPSIPKRKVFNNLVKRYVLWPCRVMKYDSGFVV